MTACELLADLVDPPDPACPDIAITFFSHAAIVDAVTDPCGATRDTKSLSDDLIGFVALM